MRTKLLTWVSLMVVWSAPAWAQSGAPDLLGYHDQLVDSMGQPITGPTKVRFRLIQGGTVDDPESGSVVFEEQAMVEPDEAGNFEYVIGSNASGRRDIDTLDAEDLNTTEPVFIEVAVTEEDAAGKQTFEVLLPRQQIVSDGYALQAEYAANASNLTGTLSADNLPGDGYADTYVNVTGDTMTGGLQINDSLRVGSGGPSLGTGDAYIAKDLQVGANSFHVLGSQKGEVRLDIPGFPADSIGLRVVMEGASVSTPLAPTALYGVTRGGIGVVGIGGLFGVQGETVGGDGVSGGSRDGIGVDGSSSNWIGVRAHSTNNVAVFARSDNGNIIEGYDGSPHQLRFLVTNAGNVGIGTTNPVGKLQIIDRNRNANGTTLVLGPTNTSHLRLGYNSTYSWIQSHGARPLAINPISNPVGIGTTSPSASYRLDVAGATHASSFPMSSDARLKTNVRPLTDVLEKLNQLHGVSFEWNEVYESLGRATGHREIGVLAQEVEEVFPELITTWGEEGYRAVDYGRLTAVLIEAVKELKAEIEALKGENETLKVTMKQRINALEEAVGIN